MPQAVAFRRAVSAMYMGSGRTPKAACGSRGQKGFHHVFHYLFHHLNNFLLNLFFVYI